MKYLALDFGGTFVKHCIMDEDANITERGEIPAPSDSAEHFVQVIADLYDQVRGQVDGIGISMPGVIDSDTGHLYSAGAYNEIMIGKNLYELLKDKVDVPVAVENDAKSAILAEQWKGSLQGVQTACCVILGSGLGGGIIMDGKLQKGSHFASGEISGLNMVPGVYSIGNSAASNASTTALLKMVAAAKGLDEDDFEIAGHAKNDGRQYTGKDVFRWIDEGDPETVDAYQKWLANLGQVIFNLKMILDPDKIVLGGGVSRNPRLLHDVRAEYDRYCEPTKEFRMPVCEIDTCTFTADANMVGAIACLMQKMQK